MLRNMFFDTKGQPQSVSTEDFKDEAAKILEFKDVQALELILGFVQNESKIDFDKVSMLMEFSKCFPIHSRRVKTSSTGMDLVMHYDPSVYIKQNLGCNNGDYSLSDQEKSQ